MLDATDLAYVDVSSDEWGPLVSSHSSQWQYPPHDFPALFFIPLSTGNSIWLRLEGADELRIVYRMGKDRTGKHYHMKAFRAAPRRHRGPDREPAIVSLVSICMLHSFGDGNCFMPVMQDLLALYEAERSNKSLPPLQGSSSFDVLERRLLDAIWCRPTPDRASFRGTCFKFQGRGYGHGLDLQPGIVVPLMRAAENHRLPLDTTLLTLVACAMACADRADQLEFTVFVPMRDGLSEVSMVGLFSDWRDLAIGVDFELSTVLGTALQLNDTIQNRRWKVYNALRKPERFVVNMQLLDVEPRGSFKQLGEHLFWGGDRFGRQHNRNESLTSLKQIVSISIDQKDEFTWWIGLSVSMNERPPSWMRRFVAAFQSCTQDFLYKPLAQVHRPLPDTDLPHWLRDMDAK